MSEVVSKVDARFIDRLKRKTVLLARRYGASVRIIPHIPTACVTGSVGKTSTCRMVASILAEAGKTSALVTTLGSYVGNLQTRAGDSSSGLHASRVLFDRRAQAGVFEIARGGLINEGMLFEGYDVGAVLNIYDNHVGLNGIQNRAQMAQIKQSVVINAQKMVVLNADDPLCLAMRHQVRAQRICLVSAQASNGEFQEHQSTGGVAVCLDGVGAEQAIKLFDHNTPIGSMLVSDIPASWGGAFRPATYNALFATAIAHGLGVAFSTIHSALRHFDSSESSNPGRMNFYDHLPYKLLMTFADGPQATGELARFVRELEVRGNKYLMLSSMDNRPDDYIMAMARSLGGIFSTYVCAEYDNLRERKPGEVVSLLAQGFREGGASDSQIVVSTPHERALETAFSLPKAGDLLVVSA